MYTKLLIEVFKVVLFQKSGHKSFARSGPLLQIRSHIIALMTKYLDHYHIDKID